MVGFSAEKEFLPGYCYPIAGAASGSANRALIQPLDVVKIRFQVCAFKKILLLSKLILV